ncbi:MAG: hypothetical protein Ct9H300mP6_02230 [Gammaproteobacteria bacterium]|nr:MAG: hypothetical protein Ct9H300mP6_02230 [Gammaproteobacteria bacterium]
MINHFTSEQGKMYFGIISAGGSLGAFSGSSIARYFSTEVCGTSSMSDWGPFSLILISILGLTIALLLSTNFKSRLPHEEIEPEEVTSTKGIGSMLIPIKGSMLGEFKFIHGFMDSLDDFRMDDSLKHRSGLVN